MLTRNLGPLIDQIEFDIPEKHKLAQRADRKPRYINASKIKDCSRQLFYSLTGWYEQSQDVSKPAWRDTAAMGTIIHDQIQKALIEYGVITATETYVPRIEGISGRIDGILTATPCLLEIKTMGAPAWRTLPDNEKFDSYQDQIQIYLEMLDLPEALLVCVRREPIIEGKKFTKSLCKEFVIKRDRQRGQELLAKARMINDAVTNNIVPKAEPGDSCMFCPFQVLCELHDIEESTI
jgi:CRISPR/Cas system-associated exonuclease Cas4 (RecB family)